MYKKDTAKPKQPVNVNQPITKKSLEMDQKFEIASPTRRKTSPQKYQQTLITPPNEKIAIHECADFARKNVTVVGISNSNNKAVETTKDLFKNKNFTDKIFFDKSDRRINSAKKAVVKSYFEMEGNEKKNLADNSKVIRSMKHITNWDDDGDDNSQNSNEHVKGKLSQAESNRSIASIDQGIFSPDLKKHNSLQTPNTCLQKLDAKLDSDSTKPKIANRNVRNSIHISPFHNTCTTGDDQSASPIKKFTNKKTYDMIQNEHTR